MRSAALGCFWTNSFIALGISVELAVAATHQMPRLSAFVALLEHFAVFGEVTFSATVVTQDHGTKIGGLWCARAGRTCDVERTSSGIA